MFLNQHCNIWCLNRFTVVTTVSHSHLWFVILATADGTLCIKLLGGGFLISCSIGFPLAQVVAALVLLPHAVNQEQDEEDGKQEADHTAGNHRWENDKRQGQDWDQAVNTFTAIIDRRRIMDSLSTSSTTFTKTLTQIAGQSAGHVWLTASASAASFKGILSNFKMNHWRLQM